jgi:UDP-3-O-[3-hydroxymyristoyl] glucosamine N-acyltransferase
VHYSVEALAALVGGTVQGNGQAQIIRARPISEAGDGDISFAEDDRHLRLLRHSRAAAAVVPRDFQSDRMALICVEKPRRAFGTIVQCLRGSKLEAVQGIHAQAMIAATARLGSEPSVGPFVEIGEGVAIGDRCRIMSGCSIGLGCRLGDDVVVYPNVVLYPGTVLGNRVIIHAGAVIGADGFGYYQEAGRHHKDWQLGHVEIGDDVEIGANTSIDRATFYVTRIGEGTKIDNLVQIAHNCQIGRHNLIVSQVGIAGSSKTGDYVIIAGHAGIGDHIAIGDGAIVGAMAGVMKDVPPGQRTLGLPATPDHEQYRLQVMLRKLPESLPELRKTLEALSLRVAELEHRLDPKKKSA